MELKGLQGESSLVDLEGVGMLMDQHRGANDRVQIHGHAPNQDRNQHLWGEGRAYDGLGSIRYWQKKESQQQSCA
jgi:hypothetical protein